MGREVAVDDRSAFPVIVVAVQVDVERRQEAAEYHHRELDQSQRCKSPAASSHAQIILKL